MRSFIKNEEESCQYKWVNSFVSIFLILYMNKIFLIKNDIPYITRNIGFIVIIVLHKELGKNIPHPRDEDL